MVMIAAIRKLKARWNVEGRLERACIKVVYEAIMMGGNGGKAGILSAGGVATGEEGW